MPEETKSSSSSPPRLGGRSCSKALLSFPLPSPARKLTPFCFFLFCFLLLASASVSAASSIPAVPALGEALAFESSPEPGAVNAFSEVERRAATACSTSAECRAACGVGGKDSSSSPAAAAADVIDWASAPPSDLQRTREQLLSCVNAFRTMPGAFSKEVGDACDASGWLPQLEFARSAAWASSSKNNASASTSSSPPPRSPFLLDGVPALELAAQAAVDDMVEFDYFGHERPKAISSSSNSSSAGAAAAAAASAPAAPAARVRRATPGASRVGALIASGWRSPLDVVTQMACSERHRGVLLDCRFDAAGWGAAYPNNREWKSYYAIYLVCLDPKGCAACPTVEGGGSTAAAATRAKKPLPAAVAAEPKGVEWKAAEEKNETAAVVSSPSATAAAAAAPPAPTPEETKAAAAAPDPRQLVPASTETAPAGTPAAAAVPTTTASPQAPPSTPPPSTPGATTAAAAAGAAAVAAAPAPPPPASTPYKPPSSSSPPPQQLCAINMQFGAGAPSAASSPSGKPALLLLTSTGSSSSGGGGQGNKLSSLSPSDVEATLLSAPGRPRARVSAAFPHGGSGAFVVALDLPANYTGEVSVVTAVGGGSSNGEKKLSPLTFAVVRSPRVLVTASLPVE